MEEDELKPFSVRRLPESHGFVIFGQGYLGRRVILDVQFKDIPTSPLLLDALDDFLSPFPTEQGRIYKLTGTIVEIQKMVGHDRKITFDIRGNLQEVNILSESN